MSFFVEGDTAVIQINDDSSLEELQVFAIEEMFGCILGQTKWVTGKSLIIKSVHCSYGPRPYADFYQKVFQCPVHFDSPHNQIRFAASMLDTRLPQASSHSAGIYKAYCEELAAQLDQADDDFVKKVRRVIMSHSQLSPSSDEVAAVLCMSERTLRRKLNEEGFSYHQLVDDVREGIAKNYLTSSQRSVEDIAFTIGFSDSTSFSRAFKRWTGQSPKQFRNAQ
jgi:AraC-like DNA-binding protein